MQRVRRRRDDEGVHDKQEEAEGRRGGRRGPAPRPRGPRAGAPGAGRPAREVPARPARRGGRRRLRRPRYFLDLFVEARRVLGRFFAIRGLPGSSSPPRLDSPRRSGAHAPRDPIRGSTLDPGVCRHVRIFVADVSLIFEGFGWIFRTFCASWGVVAASAGSASKFRPKGTPGSIQGSISDPDLFADF